MVVRELGSDWDSEVSYYPLLFLCVGVCGLEGGASSVIFLAEQVRTCGHHASRIVCSSGAIVLINWICLLLCV